LRSSTDNVTTPGRDVLAHYEIEIRAPLKAIGIAFLYEIKDGQFQPADVFAARQK
jgi:hypothetical protein